MNKYLFIALSALVLFSFEAKSKPNQDLIKANYLYRHYAFHEAIVYYEKIVQTSTDAKTILELADCYRYTKDMEKAAFWYNKALQMSNCEEVAKLKYALTLMTLQKYDEAYNLLVDYQKAYPEDKRIANLIKSCTYAQVAITDMPEGYVTLLPFNTDGSEFGPAYRKGELYFTSDSLLKDSKGNNLKKSTNNWTGANYYNIYRINCKDYGKCDSEIKYLPSALNTKYHDGPSVFTSDGNTMYFTRTNYQHKFYNRGSIPDQDGTVHLQIMIGQGYDPSSGTFQKITPFKYNSKKYSTAHPAISPNGKTLVFVSDMPGGKGGNDLYVCYLEQDGSWSAPQNLTHLNTEGNDVLPTFYNNNTLYFSSDGHVGFGGLDIYKATFDKKTADFNNVKHLGLPVNSSYDDMSLTLMKDKTHGYFASNRPAAQKGDNIYFVNLQKVFVEIKVIDDANDNPITAANISFSGGKDLRSIVSDENGSIFAQLYPQTNYSVSVSKIGYETIPFEFNTLDIVAESDTLYYEVRLKNDFKINYNVVVYNEETRTQLGDATVIIAKLGSSDQLDSVFLGDNQAYRKVLEPNSKYSVYAVKDNFFGNERLLSTENMTKGHQSINIYDTIFMKELRVGEIYKIENIYYDYNKATIRDDAKPSLNQLIKLLGTYPEMVIKINSHTDCRGSNAYNQKLSQARANSVIKYLQQNGISADRLKHQGYGESLPVIACPNCEVCSEDEHQKNRRTEFEILSM